MERIRVRPGAPQDSAEVARMGNALNRELGIEGDPFTAEGVLRDGFGANPRFGLLVAEVGGTMAGYAMYHAAYDSDLAAAAVKLVDLYVGEPFRRTGVGRELMRAMARETIRAGAKTLEWGVHEANASAIAFYRALGATGGSVRTLEVKANALTALAGVPSPDGASEAPRESTGTAERRPGSDPEP